MMHTKGKKKKAWPIFTPVHYSYNYMYSWVFTTRFKALK